MAQKLDDVIEITQALMIGRLKANVPREIVEL